MSLHPIPITTAEANDFIASHHRHNKPVRGARWAVGASDGNGLVGVAIVGRPTARELQQLAARDPAGWQSRAGREWQPVVGQAKLRWEWRGVDG